MQENKTTKLKNNENDYPHKNNKAPAITGALKRK
jgi:hypothetical protein